MVAGRAGRWNAACSPRDRGPASTLARKSGHASLGFRCRPTTGAMDGRVEVRTHRSNEAAPPRCGVRASDSSSASQNALNPDFCHPPKGGYKPAKKTHKSPRDSEGRLIRCQYSNHSFKPQHALQGVLGVECRARPPLRARFVRKDDGLGAIERCFHDVEL
jgi:hypothetical protein